MPEILNPASSDFFAPANTPKCGKATSLDSGSIHCRNDGNVKIIMRPFIKALPQSLMGIGVFDPFFNVIDCSIN